jgi:DNA-binding response OmpR family regulator
LAVKARHLGINTEDVESQSKFLILGDEIYFEGKRLQLSKRSKALLRTLINSQGSPVSGEEVKNQVFPQQSSGTISEEVLAEAVRRLKLELTHNRTSPELLEVVHGEGYILGKIS